MYAFNAAACLAASLLAAVAGGDRVSREEREAQAEKAALVKAEGDALIASAGANALFANETRDGAILIRHKPSNFQCLFNPGVRNVLAVTDRAASSIGCDGPSMMFHVSYAIERAKPEETLESAFENAVGTVKARWPDAMNVKVEPDSGQELLNQIAAKTPPSETSWFLAKEDSGWAFSRVSVSKVGDWIVTMRASGPVEAQAQSETLTEMLWLTRLMVMTDPKLGGKPVAQRSGQAGR